MTKLCRLFVICFCLGALVACGEDKAAHVPAEAVSSADQQQEARPTMTTTGGAPKATTRADSPANNENKPIVPRDTYYAGDHYVALDNPMRTANPDKIEVNEVFWYGCGHCYNFEPLIKPWAAGLADDVEFTHTPAVWNENMKTHAKLYYTAKQLGKLDEMHTAFFTAMHVEKKPLIEEAQIRTFFADFGVSEADFNKTFNSFTVDSMVKQAESRARGYQISGTPELVVNGKYRVSGRLVNGQHEMLRVTDFLINKERNEKRMPHLQSP